MEREIWNITNTLQCGYKVRPRLIGGRELVFSKETGHTRLLPRNAEKVMLTPTMRKELELRLRALKAKHNPPILWESAEIQPIRNKKLKVVGHKQVLKNGTYCYARHGDLKPR